jgi:hypothetical protein
MRNPPRILCLTVAQRRAPSGRGQIARPTQPHRFAFRLAFEMARAVRARANSHEKLRPQFLDSSRSEPSEPNARRFSSAREATFELGALLRRVDSRRANLQPFRVATIESADHTDTLNARGSRIEARGASSRERASPSRGVRAAHRASRRGSRAVFSSAFQSAARALSASPRRASRVPNLTPHVPRSRAQKGKMAQTPTFKLILVGDGGTGA